MWSSQTTYDGLVSGGPKLSSTLRKLDYITDEAQFVEVISVSGYVSARDLATDKFVVLELSDVDEPGRWRKVIPASDSAT